MTNDALKQLVTALYEGRPLPDEPRLTNGCEFRDPVVVVRGAERVFSMFRKLNRLYPASKVVVFEPQAPEGKRFRLVVHYRRKSTSKPRPFETEIEFEFQQDRVARITEDWRSPLHLSGRGQSLLSKAFRSIAGRVLS